MTLAILDWMRARRSWALGGIGAAALLAGCAGSQPPVDRYYRLEPSPTTMPPIANAPMVLLAPFEAYGVVAERYLLHRDAAPGSAIVQYNYQFWTEPPALMLTDLSAQRLRATLGPALLVDRGTRARPAFTVTPRLRRLEQVLDGQGASAAFAADFAVADRQGAPLFVVSIDETVPAVSAAPEAFVAAVDGLVADANDRLLKRLAEEFGRTPQ